MVSKTMKTTLTLRSYLKTIDLNKYKSFFKYFVISNKINKYKQNCIINICVDIHVKKI